MRPIPPDRATPHPSLRRVAELAGVAVSSALRALEPAVRERGPARPAVDVVSFDGDALLESVGRPIGVTERQSTGIGRTAADLLLERLHGLERATRFVPSVFRPPARVASARPTTTRAMSLCLQTIP